MTSSPADYLRLLFIPLAFFLLASELSSPGTDLPAVMLSWLVFSEWLALIERETKHLPRCCPSCLLFTPVGRDHQTLQPAPPPCRPLPLVEVSAQSNPPHILSLRAKPKPKRGNLHPSKQGHTIFKLLIIALILFLPWVIRNLILSGYLVYPGLTFDPFHFDWRIPAEAVRRESAVITAWARFSAGRNSGCTRHDPAGMGQRLVSQPDPQPPAHLPVSSSLPPSPTPSCWDCSPCSNAASSTRPGKT